MKRQQDIQRVLEDFEGSRKMREAKSLHQERELPMSLGEFYTKLHDVEKYDETELEHEENETENSIDEQGNDTREMKGIPEVTSEELQTAITRLKKKANQQWNQS